MSTLQLGEILADLSNIAAVATDHLGNMYLSDEFQHRILKFSPAGECLWVSGQKGEGPCCFCYPAGLVVHEDRLYVCDSWNHKIRVLDLEGNEVSQFGSFGNEPGAFTVPMAIAVGPDGHLWIADGDNHRIQVFDPVFQKSFGRYGVPKDSLVAAWQGDEVGGEPLFSYPRSLYFFDGSLIVCDNDFLHVVASGSEQLLGSIALEKSVRLVGRHQEQIILQDLEKEQLYLFHPIKGLLYRSTAGYLSEPLLAYRGEIVTWSQETGQIVSMSEKLDALIQELQASYGPVPVLLKAAAQDTDDSFLTSWEQTLETVYQYLRDKVTPESFRFSYSLREFVSENKPYSRKTINALSSEVGQQLQRIDGLLASFRQFFEQLPEADLPGVVESMERIAYALEKKKNQQLSGLESEDLAIRQAELVVMLVEKVQCYFETLLRALAGKNSAFEIYGRADYSLVLASARRIYKEGGYPEDLLALFQGQDSARGALLHALPTLEAYARLQECENNGFLSSQDSLKKSRLSFVLACQLLYCVDGDVFRYSVQGSLDANFVMLTYFRLSLSPEKYLSSSPCEESKLDLLMAINYRLRFQFKELESLYKKSKYSMSLIYQMIVSSIYIGVLNKVQVYLNTLNESLGISRLRFLAELAWFQGEYDESLKYLDDCDKIKMNAYIAELRAFVCMSKGAFSEARKTFCSIDNSPDAGNIKVLVGVCLRNEGKHSEARLEFKSLGCIAYAYYHLGISYRMTGDHDKALECFDLEELHHPKWANLLQIGITYLMKGDEDEFHKAIELLPKWAHVVYQGHFLSKADTLFEKALRELARHEKAGELSLAWTQTHSMRLAPVVEY